MAPVFKSSYTKVSFERDWIMFQQFQTWFHKVWLGADGGKQFTCGDSFVIAYQNMTQKDQKSPTFVQFPNLCFYIEGFKNH